MRPKCLLPIGGETILSNMLGAISAAGVRRVVIVVGYERGEVIGAARACAAGREELGLTFVENDRFDETNTLGSLHLAREHVRGSILYFNADVWFDPQIVLDLARAGGQAPPSATGESLLALEPKPCGAEEVKVRVDSGGRVVGIGKKLDPKLCAGEFIGIARFDEPLTSALRRSLDERAASHGDAYFEFALDAVLDDASLGVLPIARGAAVEIDTPEDWDAAKGLSSRRSG